MTTYYPPKVNTAFVFYVSLVSQSDTKTFQANPTLAAGDVKVSVDDAAPANITTLPVVDADFTKRVKVSLSASEMNGANITVIFADASGAEWCDLTVNLQTVTNQLDDLATPATAWAYSTRTLTQSAASVTATVSGSTITVKRGDSWSISLTGLGSIAGRTSLWFTAKNTYSDTDAVAICQIEETNQLLYINGDTAGTASNGAITVDDEDAGDITITLQEAESKNLSPVSAGCYDVQVLNGGDVTTLTEGVFVISSDVTRAVS